MKTSPVISEESFIEWSFRQIRKKLIDCNDSNLRSLIANYVIRFFIGFIFPNSIDKTFSLEDISKIYAQVFDLLSVSRDERLKLIESFDWEIFECCNKSEYAITMLCDIAHTSALVEEIITKKIDLQHDENYYWIDLWTGSWILLDAQDICRERNWLPEWMNIGIDICDDHIKRSQKLLSQFSNSVVKKGDLTEESTYQSLPKKPISQISAELIWQPWVSVLLWEDPFHATMQNLFLVLWGKLSNTTFFPEEFHMSVQYFWKEVNAIIWTRENWFQFEAIFDTVKWIHQTEIGKKLKQYKWDDLTIECKSIKVNWKISPLEDIWKGYEWIVTQGLEKKPRRWINQRLELEKYLNSGDMNMKIWIIWLVIDALVKEESRVDKYLRNTKLKKLINLFKRSKTRENYIKNLCTTIINNNEYLEDIINCIRIIPLHFLK